jgi:hypothetical protein
VVGISMAFGMKRGIIGIHAKPFPVMLSGSRQEKK